MIRVCVITIHITINIYNCAGKILFILNELRISLIFGIHKSGDNNLTTQLSVESYYIYVCATIHQQYVFSY